MIGRATRVAILVFVAGAVVGCGITDVGKPLSVAFTADRTAASVGDTISFEISGTGSFMSGLTIDFGEEGADDHQFEPGGSQTAKTSARHAYASAGTFLAIGTVLDSSGQLSDTIEVVIDGE